MRGVVSFPAKSLRLEEREEDSFYLSPSRYCFVSSEICPTPAPMAPSATGADSSVGKSESNDLQVRDLTPVQFHKGNKGKQKQKKKPKKKKLAGNAETLSEVSIQARFCRAVTELQIAGLIRMQSKRRPDFVQRVAFGL